MSDHKISVILTQADVSYGTHAQDLKTALDVDPNMTIRELVESELTEERHKFPEGGWANNLPAEVEQVANHGNYLTIRIARKVKPNA